MLNTPLWKKIIIAFICFVGLYLALPNFVNTQNWPIYGDTQKKLNLGLDLRGGSHLLLEVDFDEYMKDQYRSQLAYVRTALRAEKIGYQNLKFDEKGVSLDVRDAAEVEKAQKILLDADPLWQVDVVEQTLQVRFKDRFFDQKRSELIEQSIEIIRRRVDESGTKEPLIQRQGDQRIVLQIAGEEDPEAIKSRINTAAKLTFHMVAGDATKDTVPALGNIILQDNKGEYYEVEEEPLLGGENLDNATQSFDSFGNVAVSFKFDSIGGRIFGDVTKANVNKRFASVLDGVVVSAPVIREPILGGNGQITGNFSVTEASELATLLRAGALPASLKILEERTVGASLGADSIAQGQAASIIAITVVSVFMFIVYGFAFGAISVFCLMLNVLLIIACLSLFQATLTLPGIAGIVLIVGMAVDANVLIFERIKEEAAAGKKLVNAIFDGFDRAWATIFDSNVTTLIMGLLLFTMGSGPVRGFAVTLSIGILCTMFTAVTIGRILVFEWFKRTRPTKLSIAYKK
jgi:preprotein translocase subunit SecD